MARGEVIRRLRRQPPGTCPSCGHLVQSEVVIDERSGVVRRGSLEVRMEPRFAKLLVRLMQDYPKTVHNDHLIMSVWPDENEPPKAIRSIYTLMCILRRSVEPLGIYVHSERGVGYYVKIGVGEPRLRAVS